jgi:hypothetical protein
MNTITEFHTTKEIADHEESLTPQAKGPGLGCNTISIWPIALRARASPVQNVGPGVVVKELTAAGSGKEKFRANCQAPESGKEFEFEASETRIFEVSVPLFERRHFFRSELR